MTSTRSQQITRRARAAIRSHCRLYPCYCHCSYYFHHDNKRRPSYRYRFNRIRRRKAKIHRRPPRHECRDYGSTRIVATTLGFYTRQGFSFCGLWLNPTILSISTTWILLTAFTSCAISGFQLVGGAIIRIRWTATPGAALFSILPAISSQSLLFRSQQCKRSLQCVSKS